MSQQPHNTLVIGADHRGFEYKQRLIEQDSNVTWIDVGTDTDERTDFPLYVERAVHQIQIKKVKCGVLLCGSGIGMSIAANRFSGIYAALVWNIETAKLAKEHNNANILIIPADFVTYDQMVAMIQVWQTTTFKGGRYQERIESIDQLPCE